MKAVFQIFLYFHRINESLAIKAGEIKLTPKIFQAPEKN